MHRKSGQLTTLLVTGGIGSGKSAVSRFLALRGIPVYDSDSRTKLLYDSVPGLAGRINESLGGGLLKQDGLLDRRALASLVFSDKRKLIVLESIIHPEVLADFCRWRDSLDAEMAAMESAIAMDMELFDGIFDYVILVEASERLRIERAARRDSSSIPDIKKRIEHQHYDTDRADAVIVNDGTISELQARTDEAIEKILYLQSINEHKHR